MVSMFSRPKIRRMVTRNASRVPDKEKPGSQVGFLRSLGNFWVFNEADPCPLLIFEQWTKQSVRD